MTEARIARPTTALGVLLGVAGLAWLPALMILDTEMAKASGWPLVAGGTFAKLVYLAWLAIAVTVACLLLKAGRRFLGGNAKAIWVGSVVLAFSLFGAETFFRMARPRTPFHGRPAGAVFDYDPDPYSVPGVFGPARSTINSLGFRGAELPAERSTYRVLCVGGSSVECSFLDDAESWPGQLEKDLNAQKGPRYWVAGAGFAEYATGHHQRFIAGAPGVIDVDCYLVMPGANDLLRLLLGLDMGEAAPPRWMQSELLSTIKEIWNVRLNQGIVIDADGRGLKIRQMGLNIPPRAIDQAAAIAAYEARLKRIVETAKSQDKRLVFVTQPVMWDDFLTTIGNRWLRYARVYPYPRDWEIMMAGPLRALVEKYNAALKSVCATEKVEIVDPAATMNAIEMYFYDDFHLNERGCKELARIVADYFEKHPPAK